MTPSEYNEVLERVERLPREDQESLFVEIEKLIEQPSKHKHHVSEFRGVGKANPIGIDAQDFVNQERDSWDG